MHSENSPRPVPASGQDVENRPAESREPASPPQPGDADSALAAVAVLSEN